MICQSGLCTCVFVVSRVPQTQLCVCVLWLKTRPGAKLPGCPSQLSQTLVLHGLAAGLPLSGKWAPTHTHTVVSATRGPLLDCKPQDSWERVSWQSDNLSFLRARNDFCSFHLFRKLDQFKVACHRCNNTLFVLTPQTWNVVQLCMCWTHASLCTPFVAWTIEPRWSMPYSNRSN